MKYTFVKFVCNFNLVFRKENMENEQALTHRVAMATTRDAIVAFGAKCGALLVAVRAWRITHYLRQQRLFVAGCSLRRRYALLLLLRRGGAIVCILKGYSRNNEACDIIENIYELLERTGATLEMRWIAGVSNVADQPSRLDGLEEARRGETWIALKGDMALPRPKGRQVREGEARDPEFD